MKRFLHIWLFVLTAVMAVAQERKDSIQILFPDSGSTTLQLDYLNTSQVVDSIVASLALPQNAQRPIILSTVTPPQGVVSFYNGKDSIALERLQSVALLLSEHGVADSLIHYDTEFYDSLSVADTLKTATLLPQSEGVWLHIPGGEWLGTGTYDISPLAQQMPDSVVTDSVAISAPVIDEVATVGQPQVPTDVVAKPKAVNTKSPTSRTSRSVQKARPSHTPSVTSISPTHNITSINNARTMDSLFHLVSLLQDTIAQYRQQIAELRQFQSQIMNTSVPDSTNATLYVIVVVLLVVFLMLLLYSFYEHYRTKTEIDALKEEIAYNGASLRHVIVQRADNQQLPPPTPVRLRLISPQRIR